MIVHEYLYEKRISRITVFSQHPRASIQRWCEICSNKNGTKQRASLRFAQATAAPSKTIRSLRCVIETTLSSFDLFLSADSYYPIDNPAIHQVSLNCNSVLKYGPATKWCTLAVILISSSKWRNKTALIGKFTSWSTVSVCFSDEANISSACCFLV